MIVKKMSSKRGEMGIGTLLLLIASMLIAVIAAGVLLSSAGRAQEKAFSSVSTSNGQVSTMAEIIEISATNGLNGNLTDFYMIVKLSPGGQEVKLDSAMISFSTENTSSTLKYAGTAASLTNGPGGYNTNVVEEFGRMWANATGEQELRSDLDLDKIPDYISINDSHVRLNLSASGQSNYYLGDTLTGSNVLSVDVMVNVSRNNLARLIISGTATEAGQIDDNVSFRLVPYKEGYGFYAAQYIQEGTNHVEGNLQHGDVVKFYFEAPEEVPSDEYLRISFYPKVGISTVAEFYSPSVLHEERVYLYPSS